MIQNVRHGIFMLKMYMTLHLLQTLPIELVVIIDDISCISLYKNHMPLNGKIPLNTPQNYSCYNEKIGHYAYPKIIVADVEMEWNTHDALDGDGPGYRGLLAHEVGHNWFFGMVASNETYRAALDEGFTQFLTALAQENIDGPFEARKTPKKWYVQILAGKG